MCKGGIVSRRDTSAGTAEGERSPRLGGKPSFHATHIWLLVQRLSPFQANLAFFLPYKYSVKTITCIISCQIDSYRAKSDYPMPKQVTENELQRIEDVLLRFPAGLSLVELRNELSGSSKRRTLKSSVSYLRA